MNTRRQFLIQAPIGLLGAMAACRGEEPVQQTGTPVAGAPPAFGTSPEVGPAVSPATFAEAEKLMQVEMSASERAMAAASWRRSLAALLERRTGPKKIALESTLAPATRLESGAPWSEQRTDTRQRSCAARSIPARCRRATTRSRSRR